MTSSDLIQGHRRITIAINFERGLYDISKTCKRIQSRGRFVPPSKFDKVRFQTAAVTLTKGSRSNDWHGGKGLGKCVLYAQ